MKSSWRECLTAYTTNINSTISFNIYQELSQNLNNIITLKIDINSTMQLNFDENQNSSSNISYKSNHLHIIKEDDKGIIFSIRLGKAVIIVNGLKNRDNKIQIILVPYNGLISNYTLKINQAKQFKNLMIVAHPDDETLWGGANLYNDKYFVVCLTNGFNNQRTNDFRKILKFTKNRDIILDYPDLQDSIRDNWSEVEIGIVKDITTVLNYNNWDKIVTHGPMEQQEIIIIKKSVNMLLFNNLWNVYSKNILFFRLYIFYKTMIYYLNKSNKNHFTIFDF